MNNTFEFIGKIVPIKETEKFKPYQDTKFPSGWAKKSIKFNVICGNNRHIVESAALYDTNNLNGMKIYTFTKGETSSDGTRKKGENIQIPFKDRNKPEIIDKVAEFKKFVIDTEIAGRRYKLEKAIDKFKDGTITNEQMTELGVHTVEEAETALEQSNAKKKVFIHEYDFVDYLNKFVNSDKIKDVLFKVTGEYHLEYNSEKDVWYRSFTIQRIYRAENDTVASQATLNLVFGKDAVDDADFAETKKYHINGYLGQYIGSFKKTCFCPMTITIDGNGDEKAAKKAEMFKKKFVFPDETDAEYREIGVVCNILDGAQTVELTMDMLTDEQRENVEFGLCTLDDIKKEIGKEIYGDRVTDIVVDSLARGYSKGANDAAYTEKDFDKPRVATAKTTSDDDNTDDIFGDDDDIDI